MRRLVGPLRDRPAGPSDACIQLPSELPAAGRRRIARRPCRLHHLGRGGPVVGVSAGFGPRCSAFGGHLSSPASGNSPSRRRSAATGTTIRRPSLIEGKSPRATAAYALFRQSPPAITPAVDTSTVVRDRQSTGTSIVSDT